MKQKFLFFNKLYIIIYLFLIQTFFGHLVKSLCNIVVGGFLSNYRFWEKQQD